MRLTVLGCSGGIGDGSGTTSLLIDDDILIDCGTGVGRLSLEAMVRLRHVFITHTHLDHIATLPLLIDTLFGQLQGRPLTVHAQPESIEVLRAHIFNWKIWPDFFELPDREHPVARFSPMSPGAPVVIDGRTLEMIPVNHAVPAVGYCVKGGDSVLAFSGDTTTNDSLWDALNRKSQLDMLIVECAFANEERALSDIAGHYCPETLAADLAKLRHHPQTCITHLKSGDEDRIMAQVTSAVPDRELHRLRSGDVFQL
jgi:ribonuclease BN (tRNA processing enzyme)